jgi:hypothetical protein
MAADNPKPMTPPAAVARHLEWLEFALAAARDEEARRQGRLERATNKNREKRTIRLAEVSAEVRELAALVTGLKGLQAKSPRGGTTRAAATSKAAATAKPKAAAAAKSPAASTTKAKAPTTRRGATKPTGTRSKAPTPRRRARRSPRQSPPPA